MGVQLGWAMGWDGMCAAWGWVLQAMRLAKHQLLCIPVFYPIISALSLMPYFPS